MEPRGATYKEVPPAGEGDSLFGRVAIAPRPLQQPQRAAIAAAALLVTGLTFMVWRPPPVLVEADDGISSGSDAASGVAAAVSTLPWTVDRVSVPVTAGTGASVVRRDRITSSSRLHFTLSHHHAAVGSFCPPPTTTTYLIAPLLERRDSRW